MKKIQLEQFMTISMREFLENYVNDVLESKLTEEMITKLEIAKATHFDITELGIPYLKRVPIDIVTEDMLLSGSIIMVADFKSHKRRGRYAPYIRPSIEKEREEQKEKRGKVYGKF